MALTPTHPLLPEYIPNDKRDFYISGSLVVVLIVMTVLGGIYFCGILVYVIISHFSRCVLPWVKDGALAGGWD